MIDERAAWALEKEYPTGHAVRKFMRRADCLGATGLAVAALSLAAVGTGVAAAGQIQEGKAAKAQADYQSQVAENNAELAKRNAADAKVRGGIASGEQDIKTRQLISRQRVALSASGQEVDVGSGLEITSDTAALGKLDSLRIVNNAEREAAGLDILASNFTADAAAKKAAGRNAATASGFNSGATLLSGASNISSQFSGFKTKGVL